ncbi:MAG: hypothetical protein RMJ82_07480 [Gemmatales bacterium]|nr:hypothetical protein [Gemmatales bacterium]
MRCSEIIALIGGILLATGLAGQDKKPVKDEEPCLFTILLPAAAHLEIEGYPVKSRGEVRLFESPAMPRGKTYVYTVRAMHDGIVVTRTIEVSPDKHATLDLRPDFGMKVPLPVEPSPKPKVPEKTPSEPVEPKPAEKKPEPEPKPSKPEIPPQFSLTGLRDLLVPINGTSTLRLGVTRKNLQSMIHLEFAGLPKGVSVNQTTIPAGANALDLTFRAASDASPGKYLVKLRAHALGVQEFAQFSVTVVEQLKVQPIIPAKPQPAESPPTKPESPASGSSSPADISHPLGFLKLSGPNVVILSPGQPAKLLFRVSRQRIGGPVHFHWTSLPANVNAPAATLKDEENEAILVVTPSADAAPIVYNAQLTVSAAGGAVRLEIPVRMEIR